jgi:flagellar biosynthesis protein FlhF
LQQIRAELSDLRNLLERQMSGLAWGDEARRHPARAKIIRDLAELGLDTELSRSIATRVPDDLSAQHGWIKAIETLVGDVAVANDDVLERGGVVALVGPTGVGKTTTIAKLAARYALRHGRKRVALVTIDNYRIGAHEQLRTYGRIMDVPVYTVKSPDEMRGTLDDLVDKDLVLIDTAGMSHRDQRIQDQFSILSAAQPNIKTYLVMAATTQFSGLNEIAQVFKGLSLQGCVLTKLDETTQLGGALSAVIAHRLPLLYLSDGQRVPEDLHVARAKNLVYRAVTLQRQTGHVAVNEESLESAFRGVAVNANV